MQITIPDEVVSELSHFSQQRTVDEAICTILNEWLIQQKVSHKRRLGSMLGTAQITGDIVNPLTSETSIWQVLR